jgi:hypothetical protein
LKTSRLGFCSVPVEIVNATFVTATFRIACDERE